ncbi:hypothetical protein PIB30_018571 [Stylosanthes scabra]|uniref:Uncharacterized protein n=1 Tax=Stylosanthes scabra TaxID=79078 RepID=A0ABU6R875_9FABA|nr:hypothetical protein [Stylosanthes scabra]
MESVNRHESMRTKRCVASTVPPITFDTGSIENQLLGYENSLYRLDAGTHIAGRLQQLPERVLRSRRMLLPLPDDRAREYLDLAGFGDIAYIVPFEHDWALISVLIER